MANALSSAIRTILTGPAIDGSRLRVRLTIENAAATISEDVSALVSEWGTTKLEAKNYHPRQKGMPPLPVFDVTMTNQDGYFSPRVGTAIWSGQDYKTFFLLVDAYVDTPAAGNYLSRMKFRIVDANISESGDKVTLIGSHPIASYGGKVLTSSDGDLREFSSVTA